MVKYRIINPPGGWAYGFPKIVPDYCTTPETLRGWLAEQNYPVKDVDFALEHSWYSLYDDQPEKEPSSE